MNSFALQEELFNRKCVRHGQILYYLNGMFNTRDDALDALKKIRIKTNFTFSDYKASYNQSEFVLAQLLEVLFHKLNDNDHFIWSHLSPENIVSISEVTKKKFISLSSTGVYLVDRDLNEHAKKYKEDLGSGKELVFVAHSQGNFYANEAFNILNTNGDKIHIVAVATPASYVAGGGVHKTLNSDLIHLIPNSLPANIENSEQQNKGHNFVNCYLGGSTSLEAILNVIYNSSSFSKGSFGWPGYLDNSLYAPKIWAKRQILDSKKKFSKTECLAMSLLFKTENWFGESCFERNLDAVIEGANRCYDEEWASASQVAYNCQLPGVLMNSQSSWKVTESETLLAANNPECNWKKITGQALVSDTVFRDAIKLLKVK